MKYKFKHSSKNRGKALGIKDTENIVKVLEAIRKKKVGSFSEMAEIISMNLSKREILFLATEQVREMTQGPCSCPKCSSKKAFTEEEIQKELELFLKKITPKDKEIVKG